MILSNSLNALPAYRMLEMNGVDLIKGQKDAALRCYDIDRQKAWRARMGYDSLVVFDCRSGWPV
jgi:hypothetical protein